MIDLRSDTVTTPSTEMLEAMFQAEVGDDVFGEDPSVNKLEAKCATLFGVESAIYCPSGTMTNQIGINILSNPYEEVICYKGSHIYKYEGGGVAGNSGLSFHLLEGNRGKLLPEDVLESINPDDIHFPASSVLALENTVNKGGGSCYTIGEIMPIVKIARDHGIKTHLDGARLFNAIVKNEETPNEYGTLFDTISICLSKGLGAPVGSVLLGSKDIIQKARRVRKYFGGGMRQAGYLAAAGIYALDNNVKRLREDHKRAQELGEVLKNKSYVHRVMEVETNIVIFELEGNLKAADFLVKFEGEGVRGVAFGPKEVRLVTHLDFDDTQLEKTMAVLSSLKF